MSEFVEAGCDDTADAGFIGFDAAGVVQQNVPGFAPGSVSAGGHKLCEALLEHSDRDTPNVRTSQNAGLFPRGEFRPKSLYEFLAMSIGCPGRSERRQMGGRMGTVVAPG